MVLVSRDNWEPYAPPTCLSWNQGPPFSPLSFTRSFLFLKLDSGSHLTVTLFVGLTLVLVKALLLF